MSSQVVNLKVAGLQTYYQSLMEISPGALLKANNTVINRLGVIEPRRGFKAYGPSFGEASDRAKQIFQYKNALIRHVNDKLSFNINGNETFTDFLGTFLEPISGYRIKHREAKGNVYFTTNESVKKLSVKNSTSINESSIQNAGIPRATIEKIVCVYDFGGFLPETTTSTTSFADADYSVNYKIAFAYTDDNENLLIGPPSDTFTVTNYSRLLKTSTYIKFKLPTDITTKYKYRIYRSEISSTTPSEEFNLIHEATPTEVELEAGNIEYFDSILEFTRLGGVPLYTNQFSGEGILQSNEAPPSALDLDLFNGHMFYANTRLKQYIEFELLKTQQYSWSDSQGLRSGVTNFIIADENSANTFVFQGGTSSIKFTLTRQFSSTDPYQTMLIFYSANGDRRYLLEIINTSNTTVTYPLLAGTEFDVSVGTITVSASTTVSTILTLIQNTIYSFPSATYDFDIYVKNNDIFITNNNNGLSSPPSVEYSTNPSSTLFTTAMTSTGSGEDIPNKKILISNGFTYSAYCDGASWQHASNVINFTSGNNPIQKGFLIGDRIKVGDSIPTTSNKIVGITSTSITLNSILVGPFSGRRVLKLGNMEMESAKSTAKSITRVVNGSNIGILAYYSGENTNKPGNMFFERTSFSNSKFFIGTSDDGAQKLFSPNLNLVYSNTNITLQSPTTISVDYRADNYLFEGDEVLIFNSNTNENINGISSVIEKTRIGLLLNYKINKNIINVTQTGSTMTTSLKSTQEESFNRIYYSKYQQPEAVPILNYIDIGDKDSQILKIISSKDSLFILKKDGVYKLSGEGGSNPIWNVSAFDNTIILIAPDSVVTLANDCYFLSNQGYMKLNESGISYISSPIEDKILPFLNSSTSISTSSFSIAYESDRSLLAWTILDKNDTYATVCYRYNLFTQAWTEWKIAKTCGIINPFQDKLYLGSAIDNYIEVERKNFNRFDSADREININLSPYAINDINIKLNHIELVEEGDALTQVQYVTIYQFNSFLKKLDLDNGLGSNEHNFYNLYKLESGDSLTSKLTLVVEKLSILDTSTDYSALWSSPEDFLEIQNEYNNIITALNNSQKTYFNNYKLSTGSVIQETIIVSVNVNKKEVIGNTKPSFLLGSLKLYKAIKTEIEYAPQHAGDVLGFKQFSTGTLLFERRSFKYAKVSYNSDISDSFEEIPLSLEYASTYGSFDWGNNSTWGGQGDKAQIRTYIPLKKQKCRFLGCKFYHNTALENFQLYGLSISTRPFAIPDRNYK